MYPFKLRVQVAAHEVESTVCVTNVRSEATPLASVSAMPVTTPSGSFRTTLVESTFSVVVVEPDVTSAVTVMSTSRILENSPDPVTSTVETSSSPSMKSILDDPEMTTSFVLSKITSVNVKSEPPRDSIPTALFSMVNEENETSLSVSTPYFKAAPVLPVIVPEKSVLRSLR